MIQLTYRYRIYPTEEQMNIIQNICSCARFVYNKALEERTKHYRATGNWAPIDRENLNSRPFLKDIDRGALEWSISSLEAAYRQFFWLKANDKVEYRDDSFMKYLHNPNYALMDSDLKGYPKFKKKKESLISYTTYLPQFEVQKNHFFLPTVGQVRIKYHRPLPENSTHICLTILKKRSGRYFVLIRFTLPYIPKKTELNNPIGIVYEPGTLAVRSDRVPVIYRHKDLELTKQIQKGYKTLKRRTPGSKRYEKQREYLASLYEHRANQRRDDLHKAARQIANAGDVFHLQKPDVRSMLQSETNLAKHAVILDEAWWTFSSLLKYKAETEGKHFFTVHRSYPVYSICSFCGYQSQHPQEFFWICPECDAIADIDYNAARVLAAIGHQYIREFKKNRKE